MKAFRFFLFASLLVLACVESVAAQTGGHEDGREYFSVDFGVSLESRGSLAYYFEQPEFTGGFDTWINARISGDAGKLSYFFGIGTALLYAPRNYLGTYQINVDEPETIGVYSEPAGYFPYSYRSEWGGFVFPLSALNSAGPTGWPDSVSIGFNLFCEIAGAGLGDALQWRAGRFEREAAGMVEGGSLVLNKFAQPFFGFDLQFSPSSWLDVYSLSGMLEYYDSQGIQKSALNFQNAFSLSMISVKYKNYLHIDTGSTVIWPKRFEMGYLFPLMPALLYQNNIGDFDNLGFFGNIKLQKPGLGFLWFSVFIDEINFEKQFFQLDREMYAYQTGLRYLVPVLSFSSLTVSYTKIEPYCYTHQRVKTPWYDEPVFQAYTNHGYGLGYYLPPNSDEIKAVFTTMTSPQTVFDAQFQMIRHGADYGGSSVDGSWYESELSGGSRSVNPKLRKDFLNDGAYQWNIMVKIGAKHMLKKLPLEIAAAAGVAYSFWTDENKTLATTEYPTRTALIAQLGVKVFY